VLKLCRELHDPTIPWNVCSERLEHSVDSIHFSEVYFLASSEMDTRRTVILGDLITCSCVLHDCDDSSKLNLAIRSHGMTQRLTKARFRNCDHSVFMNQNCDHSWADYLKYAFFFTMLLTSNTTQDKNFHTVLLCNHVWPHGKTQRQQICDHVLTSDSVEFLS
jgi:hypothetical protein